MSQLCRGHWKKPHELTPSISTFIILPYIPLQSCSHFDLAELGSVKVAINKCFGLLHISEDCKGMPHNALRRTY
jgi:hypothetical protein